MNNMCPYGRNTFSGMAEPTGAAASNAILLTTKKRNYYGWSQKLYAVLISQKWELNAHKLWNHNQKHIYACVAFM